MDRLFPFGFPSATAFYLALYVLTLVIHVAFMNYVLAGTGYLVASALLSRRRTDGDGLTLADTLRDWMPFALSAAITAGVAPLLFVQILYKKNFYTANLLLFHRWMAILPVLIVGFYLLYLLKARAAERWPAWGRTLLAFGALLCFAFTAYSWTENHLLSADSTNWPGLYESNARTYWHPQLVPRLFLWAAGAVATMCLLAAWQLHFAGGMKPFSAADVGRLARLALAGLVFSGAGGLAYWYFLEAPQRRVLTGPLAGPYLAAALIGLVVQLFAWLDQLRHATIRPKSLMVCSIGLSMTLVCVTVVREALRLASIDIATLQEQHLAAASKGGLFVFLLFFAVNAGLIAWCLRLARRKQPG